MQFWFDFASTYSYVAALRLEDECAKAGVELEYRPFLLGPIFSELLGIKDSPFNVQPVRGRYMWRDLERLCEKHALPWRRPSNFPRNSVLAARVACSSANLGAEARLEPVADGSAERIGFRVGQRAIRCPQRQPERDALAPLRHRGPAVDVEERDPLEQLRGVGSANLLQQLLRRNACVHHESEVPRDRRKLRHSTELLQGQRVHEQRLPLQLGQIRLR